MAGAALRLVAVRFPAMFRLDIACLCSASLFYLPPVLGTGSVPYEWLTLAYVVIALGLYSTPVLNKAARFGDLSYGLYLYAFPVQQVVLDHGPAWAIVRCTLGSAALAFLSWHLIEAPALRLKPRGDRRPLKGPMKPLPPVVVHGGPPRSPHLSARPRATGRQEAAAANATAAGSDARASSRGASKQRVLDRAGRAMQVATGPGERAWTNDGWTASCDESARTMRAVHRRPSPTCRAGRDGGPHHRGAAGGQQADGRRQWRQRRGLAAYRGGVRRPPAVRPRAAGRHRADHRHLHPDGGRQRLRLRAGVRAPGARAGPGRGRVPGHLHLRHDRPTWWRRWRRRGARDWRRWRSAAPIPGRWRRMPTWCSPRRAGRTPTSSRCTSRLPMPSAAW